MSTLSLEVYQMVLIPLLVGFLYKTMDFIFECLIRFFTVNIKISEDSMVRNIDTYLLSTNNNTNIELTPMKVPSNTWHIRWDCGILVAVRYEIDRNYREANDHAYILYGVKYTVNRLLKKISNEMTNNEYCVKVANLDSTHGWRTSFMIQDELLPSVNMYKWQSEIVEHIAKVYLERIHGNFKEYPKKSVSALIMGPSNLGKSNVDRYLARYLQDNNSLNPIVVKGYDLTQEGLSLSDVWDLKPSKEAPVILTFDEIDKAFKNADKDEVSKDGSKSLAQNKTTLNNLLDFLERSKYIIVLATTNETYQNLQKTYPSYIREGRFDFRIRTKDKQSWNII